MGGSDPLPTSMLGGSDPQGFSCPGKVGLWRERASTPRRRTMYHPNGGNFRRLFYLAHGSHIVAHGVFFFQYIMSVLYAECGIRLAQQLANIGVRSIPCCRKSHRVNIIFSEKKTVIHNKQNELFGFNPKQIASHAQGPSPDAILKAQLLSGSCLGGMPGPARDGVGRKEVPYHLTPNFLRRHP